MTLYREAGSLILGSRLKRFGDRFLSELSQIYRAQNIDFEPSWFPVFFLIDREKRVKISQLADELMITQSGATQLIKTLESKGLLEEIQDEGRDRRTKSVGFTNRGKELLSSVRPIWSALSLVMEDILGGGIYGSYFLPALEELENNLDSIPLGEQMVSKLNQINLLDALELVPWSSEINKEYQELLFELLSLENFKTHIVSKILKEGSSEKSSEELFLLRFRKEKTIGFALKENTIFSRIYIAKEWKWQGVEEVFLDILQALTPMNKELELMVNQTQSTFLKILLQREYQNVEWHNDDILLRRKK